MVPVCPECNCTSLKDFPIKGAKIHVRVIFYAGVVLTVVSIFVLFLTFNLFAIIGVVLGYMLAMSSGYIKVVEVRCTKCGL